jgi:hypothetical protein
MRKLLLGLILVVLVVSTFSGVIYFAFKVVQDIQNNAEWEINFMRIICIMTIIALAVTSVYKKYRNAVN